VPEARGASRRAVAGLGLLALLAIAAAVWGWLRPAPALPVTATYVKLAANEAPPGGTFSGGVADDGSALVYMGPGEAGTGRIWIKQRNELHAAPLAGTEGGVAPFFSPDARWVAFFADGKLKKIPVRGGGAVTLADAPTSYYWGGWLDDGRIVYAAPGFSLQMVGDGGGTPETVVTTDSFPGRGAVGAVPLPGARGFLFVACGPNCSTSDLWVLDLKTRIPKKLLPNILGARYVATGHLLYNGGDGTWLAAPFDLRSLSLRGPGIPVLEGLARFGIVDVSRDGTLFYQEGRASGIMPVWVTRDGRVTPIDSAWQAEVGSLALSPDGRRLAVALTSGGVQNIWIKLLDRGPLSKLTFGDSSYSRPAWSPDGGSVVYVGADGKLHHKRADGTGKDSVLADIGKHAWGEASFSRDGGWLILRGLGTGSARDIYALRANEDTVLRALVATPADEYAPALSPDGRWLAYVSEESGTPEVYVRPFPNTTDGKFQVSLSGGTEPVWAHGGRELFFVNAANQLVAVEVTTSPRFSLGRQQALFPVGPFSRDFNHSAYAIAPDNRRFVMIHSITFASGDLVMVENWQEVLKEKLKQ
jgi:WD40 repeat protein